MKKIFKTMLVGLIAVFTFTGCYEQVPAGTKGKIMGASGFQPEIYPPSKVWLEQFMTMTPEQLFLMETTTKRFTETLNVKLSKEKLNVTVPVIFRGRIKGTDSVVNSLFNDMKMDDNLVTVEEVYQVYARQIVASTARDVISKYNVDELPQNYGRITIEIYNAVKPKLDGIPFEMSDVTIGNIGYPPVVEKAIELATQKRMAIEETEAKVQISLTEAKVQISLTEAKGQEEVAKAQYNIKMIEAKRIRDYNQVTAEGITEDLLELRRLELREKELDKWNGALPNTLMGGNVPVIVNSK